LVDRESEGSGETRLETWVSYVLIIGVLVSLFLEVTGIFFFDRSSHSVDISHSRSMFIRGRDFFSFLIQLLHQTLMSLTAARLMALGVAILILTPYVRAVMSVFYFLLRKNIKYSIITAFVLAVLTVSLVSH
jgi:uncharacterized membrane protein